MHEITARKASVRDIYFNIVELKSGRLLVNDKTTSTLRVMSFSKHSKN